MRRLAALLFVLTALPSAPALSGELRVCPPVGGRASSIRYYVIEDQPGPFGLRHEYIDTGASGIIFDDGTGPWRRIVHEVRVPVVRAVCEVDRTSFETTLGIMTGPRIQGELFQILSAGSGNRVGTVFVDRGTAGVRATSGAMSLELMFDCGTAAQPEPVLERVALFHSGFDVGGIDGATRAKIEKEYTSKIRALLLDRALGHMAPQGCTEITHADFAALVASGVECTLHYDAGDPGPGVY